jgi:two-component system, cell cycle sensor histidine kinase and response regulator CckA
VRSVAYDHGGFLDVLSDSGKGAEFRLYLQRAEGEVVSSEPDIEQTSVKSRVLVVDDYKSQRILTKLLLAALGHNAELAEHGHAAIEMLERDNDYDLMIYDMIMEDGLDGLDTIRKALQIKPNLPCIIATGFSETDRVRAAFELGGCACLNKPYTGKTLAKAVQRALSNELSLVA